MKSRRIFSGSSKERVSKKSSFPIKTHALRTGMRRCLGLKNFTGCLKEMSKITSNCSKTLKEYL
jgi:hypothetical protein